MLVQFSSLLFSFVFFLFLTWITQTPIVPSWGWYLSVIAPLFGLSLLAARQLTGRLLAAYLPCVVAFSVTLLLSLIDLPFEERIFIVVGTGLYYLTLLSLYRLHSSPQDETAQTMRNLGAVASLFFIYAAAYGLYLNYEVPLWLLMLVFFLATTIVSFQTLRGLSRKKRRLILLVSLTLGLIFGELVWLLHFWPFGYLTTGMVTLLLFYWLWKVAWDGLKGEFSQKEFIVESLVLSALILFLLFSSPWRMVV